MGTLDVLTELVLEVAFFDVGIGFDEVLAFLLVVTTFLVLVDLRLVLAFFELDNFWLLVAFFTIGILAVVLGFFVDVTFLMLVVFFVDTARFPRSSKSRLPIPALDSAALDVTLANPADGAVLPVLIDVMFEKKVPLVEAVVLVEGLELGSIEMCWLLLVVETETTGEDDDEEVDELEAVSDVEMEFEAVAMMAFMLKLPPDEMLELDMNGLLLEELTLGVLANEDERERGLLDEVVVELPTLLVEDDVEDERVLLDDFDGIMLDDDRLLLVDSVTT